MHLRGQHGYAMAVLLVTLSVMAILLSMVMPVWKHVSQREKETELVFRGQQYVHAIGLYQRKHGPGVLPPNIDILYTERYLRKKFKDPITDGDFQVLMQGVGSGGIAPGSGGASTTPGGRASTPQPTPATPGRGASVQGTAPGGVAGAPLGGGRGAGVIGVASKSTATSIRMYNGRTHYNEWAFLFTPTVQAPGGVPGQPGQRQGGPGTGPGRSGGPGPVTTPSPFGPAAPGRGVSPIFPPGGRGRGRGGN